MKKNTFFIRLITLAIIIATLFTLTACEPEDAVSSQDNTVENTTAPGSEDSETKLPGDSIVFKTQKSGPTQEIAFDVNNDQKEDYLLSIASSSAEQTINLKSKDEKPYKYMSQTSLTYAVTRHGADVANFKLILNKMYNNNIVYFIDYEPLKEGVNLDFEVTALNMQNEFNIKRSYYKNKGADTVDFETEEWTGKDPGLINSSQFIDYEKANQKKYMRFGKVYMAQNIGYTVYDIDFGPKYSYNVSSKGDDLSFKLKLPEKKEYHVRSDGMLSTEPLIDWKDDFTVRSAGVVDMNEKSIFWVDGLYRENESSYLPRSKQSVYKTPCALPMQSAHWVLKKGNYFQNYGVCLMYAFIESYNDKGYVPTAPKSEWLYGEFNIGHYFYDTRFNADTIMALMHIYKDYPDEKVLNRINTYFNDFYSKYAEKYSFKANNIYFISDYIGYDGNFRPSHSSLNHFIAEMRALYQYYSLTNNQKALDLAHKIMNSICASYKGWIREDGDLWYKVMPDGTYTGNDYPLVTYNDLKTTLHFINLVDKKVPDEYMSLLKSKEAWAKKKGYLK